MSDFTITVNSKAIPVTKGQTVLQASLAAGIDIPVFCWHPQMIPVGACRICLVEIEKFPKLQVACATPATEGMVVHTESERVVKARHAVLEFILAHHPLDCPTCDKGGECDLQNITFRYGLDYSRMHEPKHRFIVDEDSTFDDLQIGPEIVRNQNRCIHCYRCTRIVDEVCFEDDLGAYQRGYHTEILPPPGREIRNLYSGNVVEYCPVGALTNRDWRYKVRVWLTRQTDVICPHCPDGCNLKLWTFQNAIHRATANPNEFIDKGFICDIGRYGYQFVGSSDRLKSPMIKRQGELTAVSWEEAVSFVASQVGDLKLKLSGSGFFGLVGGMSTNEEIYAFQRLLRRVIGTNNIDYRLHRRRRLHYGDEVVRRGVRGDQGEYTDIESADTILVFGSDLHSENPITALWIKRAIRFRNAKLLIVNPIPTHLAVRTGAKEAVYKPGRGDVALLGIIDAMISLTLSGGEGRGVARAAIESFRNAHKDYGLPQAAAICGVPEETLRSVGEQLVNSQKAVIITGAFFDRDPWRDTLILALDNIKRLCKSAKLLLMPEESNSMGAQFLGALPDLLPGATTFDKKGKFEDIWRGPVTDAVGKDTIGILEAIDDDEIECGFIFNSDPVRVFPDGGYARSVLEKLKLLVVIDSFMTDTARLADVILPRATFAETSGTRTNWEGRMQYSAQAVKPLAGSKPGCEIIELLTDTLGVAFGQSEPEAVYRELSRFLPAAAPGGYDELTKEGVLVRFAQPEPDQGLSEVIVHEPTPDAEYPFQLITVNADHHRGALTERSPSLLKFTADPSVAVSSKEADRLRVGEGDLVRVESRYGKVVGSLTIVENLPEGVVLITENFGELPVTQLMGRKERLDLVKLTKV